MSTLYEIVFDFNVYLQKIPNGCSYIADALRANNLASAMKSIKDFSEGTLWLADATNLLNTNGVQYTFNLEIVKYFLESVNDNLERQNYTAVADLFEKEIASFFEQQPLVEGFVN